VNPFKFRSHRNMKGLHLIAEVSQT